MKLPKQEPAVVAIKIFDKHKIEVDITDPTKGRLATGGNIKRGIALIPRARVKWRKETYDILEKEKRDGTSKDEC